MVATHIFQKLVFSARLFIKKTSPGFCVLVFNSSGEPAAQPRFSDFCALRGSGTELEVGRTTLCEEVAFTKINCFQEIFKIRHDCS